VLGTFRPVQLAPTWDVHALPRFSVHGGELRWAVQRRFRLREVFPEDGYPLGEHAESVASRFRGSIDSNTIPRELLAKPAVFARR
jgi:hypothetical protein